MGVWWCREGCVMKGGGAVLEVSGGGVGGVERVVS